MNAHAERRLAQRIPWVVIASLVVAFLCAVNGCRSGGTNGDPNPALGADGDYDADPDALPALAARLMAQPGAASIGSPTAPTALALRRYVEPEPTFDVVATNRDGIYVRGPTEGHAIVNTRFTINGGRAGIIYDVDTLHTDDLIENCIVWGADKWCIRRYGLLNAMTRNVVVRNARTEHGDYTAVWGIATWVDFTAINCAAQGAQIRLTGNRGDSHWGDPKLITFERFTALECGQLRGAGRAGFSLSIKDSGPLAVVVIDDVLIRTVRQARVAKRSDGTWADSFGGLCVEYCQSLTMRGGYIEMRNGDRDAVQLFDYANKAARSTGPQHIDIEGLTIGGGGDIAVPLGDGDSISIRDCVSYGGGGEIKCQARGADGVWRVVDRVQLEQGLVR